MAKYQIELKRDGDRWVAIIHDLMISAEGATAEQAAAAALEDATKREEALVRHGAVTRNRDGSLRPAFKLWPRVQDLAVEYGIRGGVLLILLLAIYLTLRADLKKEISQFRNELIAELRVINRPLSKIEAMDEAESARLKQKAKVINDKLLPIAEELRPLFQILTQPGPADHTSPAK